MNSSYIAAQIKPHVDANGELTYAEFEEIFQALTLREKYLVVEFIQAEFGVNMVDEKTAPPPENFAVNQPKTFVRHEREIKMTNEELVYRAQNGDAQANQDLYAKNIRLVSKIAAKYHKLYSPQISLDDLIQEGMLGLGRAIKSFSLAKGFKFSTYATYWIFQSITRAIVDTGFIIRLPVHLMEALNKISRTARQLLHKNAREPEIEEIAAEMEIPVERARQLLFWKENFLRPTSLDAPVSEDGDTPLLEFLPAQEHESVEDTVAQQDFRMHLEKVLGTLTPRENQVITLRFGLHDGKERTLEEIGKNFGVTRERIRQIEAKALRKLRHPSRSKNLIR